MTKKEYNANVSKLHKRFRKLKKQGIAAHGDKFYELMDELKDEIKDAFHVVGGLESVSLGSILKFCEMQSSWRFETSHLFLMYLARTSEIKYR